MEKIIFRKFLYDLISFFLIVSFSLSLIVWIIQSVNYLDFISKDGHGFKVYFAFIVLNYPKIFSKIIIFSYFISLFYIILKYQSSNEILIYWTNGISKLKLVNFIFKVSIVFTIIQISVVYFLIPKSQDYSRDFIRSSKIDLFESLITEKKFIDTVKNFTIFVEKIDDNGDLQNIFLKDSISDYNNQIISAKSGKIVRKGSDKFLVLNFGQILDLTDDDYNNTKVIKFNSTTFNLSNLKTKSTTNPKLQELDSNILISCINNFLFGKKENYSLPFFNCTEDSVIKSFKEIFNRSIKQLYILVLGLLAAILIFTNDKNPKNSIFKSLIFFTGISFIVASEVNSEFLNLSLMNNLIFILLPLIIFIFIYLVIFELNKRSI
jgi:lipopolysaccharide export system permease protein|tara:strand:- start:4787 stop:5920 length:1134 start_codon:yes stop_codon:yes gene_type:complete